MNLVTDLFEIESESGVVRNKIMLNRDVADGYLLEIGKLFVYREKYNVLFPNKAQLLGFKVFTKTLKLFWIVQSSVNRDPFTFDSYV